MAIYNRKKKQKVFYGNGTLPMMGIRAQAGDQYFDMIRREMWAFDGKGWVSLTPTPAKATEAPAPVEKKSTKKAATTTKKTPKKKDTETAEK